jgi:branched-chain amino acid transport system permease protein
MKHPLVAIVLALLAAIVLWLFLGVWPAWLVGLVGAKKVFVNTVFNGVTLAGLYFLVASGFTLVFGLMRNVNLAHGSLYLFGAYVGYTVADKTGWWVLGALAGFAVAAAAGVLMQIFIFRRMEGDDLRQTMVTIGLSIVAADLMIAVWSGNTYQVSVPAWLDGAVTTPVVIGTRSDGAAVLMKYPLYRLSVLGAAGIIGLGLWLLLNKTRLGMMIRAGVDNRAMLSASGVNVQLVFATVFAIGAGLAGLAGVIGGTALSIAPGEDVRYLLASLVVVIVGGMGSVTGAALGALLIGLAEQIGLAYFPTYSVVLTFVIMIAVLAVRPQGILGRPILRGADASSGLGTMALPIDRPGPGLAVIGALLLVYPWLAPSFFVFQIGAYVLVLGTIALSLMMLVGYGGMVSLAQITVAGFAGYLVAMLGTNGATGSGLGWPWWLVVPLAILGAATFAAAIGAIAVRTAGIYTIMITLAIATAFFYFVTQNYAIFGGFNGFHGVVPPRVFGIAWRDPMPFYYLSLGVAVLAYAAVVYAARSPFGLSLQSIRDNPRRMRALGYDVAAHRVAAFFLSGLIAGTAGVLLVWFNSQISPGSVSVGVAVNVLVVAVIGGIRHPIGPFLGAILFVLLQNFAIDMIDRDRFNTVIGLVFLLVVFWSPDGILGLWERLRPHLAPPGAARAVKAIRRS